MHEILGGPVLDSQGRQYRQLGAPSYAQYLERASALKENSLDPFLPQKYDPERRHEGEGERGHWVPLNDINRTPSTFLQCFTVNKWSRMQWKFREHPYNQQAWLGGALNPYQIEQLSMCLNGILRHYGCTSGTMLGCDSGGWFKFDGLIEQFSNPFEDMNGEYVHWYEKF